MSKIYELLMRRGFSSHSVLIFIDKEVPLSFILDCIEKWGNVEAIYKTLRKIEEDDSNEDIETFLQCFIDSLDV